MMGDPPGAVAALLDDGADAVGANCSLDPGEMVGLAREMREGTDAPLVFQPNAAGPGAPGNVAGYVEGMGRIVAAGANGVEIRTGVRVDGLRVDGGAVRAVILEDGEEIEAAAVAASCDPKQVFLDLVPPGVTTFQLPSGLAFVSTTGVFL